LSQGLVTGEFHDKSESLKHIGFRRYNSQFKPDELEKSRPVVVLLKDLANNYSVTPSQLALTRLINYKKDTVVVIPGTEILSLSFRGIIHIEN